MVDPSFRYGGNEGSGMLTLLRSNHYVRKKSQHKLYLKLVTLIWCLLYIKREENNELVIY